MASQHFTDLLKKMDEVHQRKNHDYAQDSDPFSNFTRASELISWFKNPIDQVFAGIIGIKLARLAELLNGKEPKNESLDDNMLDLANYCGLWAAMKLRDREIEDSLKVDGANSGEISEAFVTGTKVEANYQVPIDMSQIGITLPVICSGCKESNSWEDAIAHAIVMHSAAFNYPQRALKYPASGLYLFPPKFRIGRFGEWPPSNTK